MVVVDGGVLWAGHGGSEVAVGGGGQERGRVHRSYVRDAEVIACRLVSSVVEIHGSHHMVGMLAVG